MNHSCGYKMELEGILSNIEYVIKEGFNPKSSHSVHLIYKSELVPLRDTANSPLLL